MEEENKDKWLFYCYLRCPKMWKSISWKKVKIIWITEELSSET